MLVSAVGLHSLAGEWPRLGRITADTSKTGIRLMRSFGSVSADRDIHARLLVFDRKADLGVILQPFDQRRAQDRAWRADPACRAAFAQGNAGFGDHPAG